VLTSLSVITAPATPVVSLAKAKAMLLVDHSADDTLITDLVARATSEVQDAAGRALITQTLQVALSGWPDDGVVRLPHPPLQSVMSVSYTDADGVLHTMAATEYVVIADVTPGVIVPAPGKSWPTDLRSVWPIRIRYVAGYGDAASAVEASAQSDLIMSVMGLVALNYEHREALPAQAAAQRARVLNDCRKHWGWQ
jgi:uncharacterized phiE125 gp8 family phage protein